MTRPTVAALLAGFAAVAMTQPAPAQPAGGLAYIQPLPPPAVQAVQGALHGAGVYTGAVDGNWGPDSAAALQRFQQMHNLQANGELNDATAHALGLQPSQLLQLTGQSQPATPPPPERLSREAVENIQRQLRKFGFYYGGIDGEWGPSSQAALTSFQANRGLQTSGQLNPETVKAMGLNPYDPAQPPPL
jgi:peptidoglycan hydrolase-like protein with peptidoglycan-binding domain